MVCLLIHPRCTRFHQAAFELLLAQLKQLRLVSESQDPLQLDNYREA